MHRPQRPGPQAPATPNRGQAILSELRRRAAESESKFWPRALSLKVQIIFLFIYRILMSLSEGRHSQAGQSHQ